MAETVIDPNGLWTIGIVCLCFSHAKMESIFK